MHEYRLPLCETCTSTLVTLYREAVSFSIMFKRAARPVLPVAAEILSPTASRLRGCSCRLSTRSRSQPMHSTASSWLKRRSDHFARTEYYGPGGADLRGIMTYRDYRKSRGELVANEQTYEDEPLLASNNLVGLLEGFDSMRGSGRKPSRAAYLALLSAAANHSAERAFNRAGENREDMDGLTGTSSMFLSEQGETGLGWKLAWCAWQDARMGDIDLGIEGLDLLIKAASPHPHLLPSLFHYVLDTPSLASNLTTSTYLNLMREPLKDSNIDQLILMLYEMRARGSDLPVGRAGQIISIATEHGLVRLALDLAKLEEAEFQRDLETSVWVDILRASADRCFVDGVEFAWERVVKTGRFEPEEGLCTLVIATAAKHHKSQLVSSVFEVLGAQGIVPKEYHFPPLLQALCGSGRVSDAMEILTGMRDSGFNADLAAAEPIVNALSKSSADVDKGFYGLQALRATGKQVDVAAFNAVLKAAEQLGDANRAMVIYRQADGLKVNPNLETYHVLLSACASAGAISQAEFLLSDMKKRTEAAEGGVSPATTYDVTTYDLLVKLYLTGTDIEKAFGYLEEMKSKGIRPPLSVYEALVKKCVSDGDGRSQPLLQEMQAGSYKPSNELISYVRKVAGSSQHGADRPRSATPRRSVSSRKSGENRETTNKKKDDGTSSD